MTPLDRALQPATFERLCAEVERCLPRFTDAELVLELMGAAWRLRPQGSGVDRAADRLGRILQADLREPVAVSAVFDWAAESPVTREASPKATTDSLAAANCPPHDWQPTPSRALAKCSRCGGLQHLAFRR